MFLGHVRPNLQAPISALACSPVYKQLNTVTQIFMKFVPCKLGRAYQIFRGMNSTFHNQISTAPTAPNCMISGVLVSVHSAFCSQISTSVTHSTQLHGFWSYGVLVMNIHHYKRNGVRRPNGVRDVHFWALT